MSQFNIFNKQFALSKGLLVKLIIWVFIIIPGIPFIVLSLGMLAYAYWPQDFERLEIKKLPVDSSQVSIMVHGLGDTAESWAKPLQEVLAKQHPSATHIALDWNPFSQSALRCSVAGKRLGKEVAKHLLKSVQLRQLHLVGHSCGAFVILGLCQGIKSQRPEVKVQTTFLDPVAVYGGLFWDYGLEHFGSCADSSEAYIDTGDTVPGSNQNLQNAVTHDVTATRLEAGFAGNPHVWPTIYYLNRVKADGIAFSMPDRF